jgi:hypothetical protein
MIVWRELTAQDGTAEAVAAQLGAIPGTHGVGVPVGPPPGAFVVWPPGVFAGVVGAPVGGVPPPPKHDPAGAGALTQAHTALADANTAPAELAPHAERTQGAAVA